MLYRSVVLVVKSTKLLHALIIASMLVIYEYASNLQKTFSNHRMCGMYREQTHLKAVES